MRSTRKRLIETLAIQIAVPDLGCDIEFDNRLAQWHGVRYAELSVLLVNLRFLAMVHQTHHWTAKGDPFYGDHLLFQRLYDAVSAEVDGLAEKAVGLGCEDTVNLSLQAQQLSGMAQAYGTTMQLPQASGLVKKSLAAEVSFLRCAARCAELLEDSGQMTRGLDNFLQGLEDKHEGHVYLLQQRCSLGEV